MRPHVLAAVLLAAPIAAPLAQAPVEPIILGRWDLTVTDTAGTYPSWLEITPSGRGIFVGRWQGRVGSARPIGRITWIDGVLHFAIPPQWEDGNGDLHLQARLNGGRLAGTLVNPDRSTHNFTGVRAPSLMRASAPAWDAPVTLFNGRDLSGWTTQGEPGARNNWVVRNAVLVNTASGANLMTTRTFNDFKLHIEFRYPRNGNSGVYLRGRYEVQVEDNAERDLPLPVHIGGVYGMLWPNENAATGPDSWQTYDITLVGRRLTVVLNGKTVINDQIIPGPTGGALDSNEGAPGPILLQGDHTAVEYRNIVLTPARAP